MKKILFLFSVLLVAAMLLTACGGKDNAPVNNAPADDAADEPAANELEIYSWWAGDEGPALEALITEYNARYPDVDVINATVAGGSGVEAKAVLKTRMLGGDPPDTFQVHAGQELIGTWVVADRMEDLTFLYEEQGWFDKYPQGLIDMMSTEDGIWSVPVNIHRSNVMWFIPENLTTWGVEAPATWDDFLAVCPDLQAQGVVPLALAQNWTHNHLWESVALGELGVDGWNALWAGEKAFTDADVVAVWEKFGEILECTNDDAASLTWQQASDMVANGEAAFNVMGDWANGYFATTKGLEPGVDYGWVASPGTDGVFMALSDAFGLPVGAPNEENVLNWLRLMGSVEGQDLFNPLKGSIAAHFDSDLSKYSAYGQSAADDWGSNTVVGSLAHGAVANETFMSGFADVMEIFLAADSSAAANAAQELCETAAICGGDAAPAAEAGGELEIYSWWAGDEGPALEALITEYNARYPDVDVINATVAGGSGVEAKAVLKTRMLGGDPPDTFQVHAGQELIGTWVVADRMEDLTFLYEEQGWFDKYPQGLIDMMSTEDGIWSVPVNIHRSNVMWFIPENLTTWGVEAPATWDDFLAVCPDLQAQGVVPLALAQNWTHNHLWESVALGELGVDGWNALWAGEKAFTDADVVAVWEKFGEILECTNDDAASLTWQQASDMVANGEAAFNVMGDWANGYFATTKGLEPGVDYGWVASPGTDGVFMALSDAFGLPVGAPNEENVLNWLRLMGSVEGQDLFNPLKGSIAAHFDSDLSKYSAYGQSAADDWGSNTVVGSLAHGAVANETFMSGFADVMEIFLAAGSETASAAGQELCIEAGICQ